LTSKAIAFSGMSLSGGSIPPLKLPQL